MAKPRNNLEELKRKLPSGAASSDGTFTTSRVKTGETSKFKPAKSNLSFSNIKQPRGNSGHQPEAQNTGTNEKAGSGSTHDKENTAPPSSGETRTGRNFSPSLKRTISFSEKIRSPLSVSKKARIADTGAAEDELMPERASLSDTSGISSPLPTAACVHSSSNENHNECHSSSTAARIVDALSNNGDPNLKNVTTEQLKIWHSFHLERQVEVLETILQCQSSDSLTEDVYMLKATSGMLSTRIQDIKDVLTAREIGSGPASGSYMQREASMDKTASNGEQYSLDERATSEPTCSGVREDCHRNITPLMLLNRVDGSRSQQFETAATVDPKRNHDRNNARQTRSTYESSHIIPSDQTTFDEEASLWAQFEDAEVDLQCTQKAQPLASAELLEISATDPSNSPLTKRTYKSAQSSSNSLNAVDQTSSPYYSEAIQVLKRVYKLDQFRTNQLEAINASMDGKDVFVLMPTGGGKSLCYQVPAVCKSGRTRGVTIVVSPLIALMIDQVHHLEAKGVDVVLLNSDQDSNALSTARARLNSPDKPSLLYVTPEKLDKSFELKNILRKLHKNVELARFVIDEAHCISTWGRDFRDSYKNLGSLRKEFPGVPIMALTATANEKVMNDVIEQLGIRKCALLTQSFNRPNLFYQVRPKTKSVLSDIATFIGLHKGETGIIYCLSRNKCEEVARDLREKYRIPAKHYHAQMAVGDKKKAQSAWQEGDCQVIVATIAFGMGIDKAVRFVIHHSLPMSMDGYYQETGRAGRDGSHAKCVLWQVYTFPDTRILYKLINDSDKTSEEEKKHQSDAVGEVVKYCQNQVECRRVQVLRYFGQSFDPVDCHNGCDNCSDPRATHEEDLTSDALQLLKLAQSLSSNDRVTKAQCAEAFRGAKTKTMRDKGFDRNALFGVGSSLSRDQTDRLMDYLLSHNGLQEECVSNNQGWNNSYVKLGSAAQSILSGTQRVILVFKVSGTSQKSAKPSRSRQVHGNNRNLAKKQRDIYEEDAIEDLDEAQTMESASWPTEDPTGTWHESKEIREREPVDATSRPDETQEIMNMQSTAEGGEMRLASPEELCFDALLRLRKQIMDEGGLSDPDEILDQSMVELLSIRMPADMPTFKGILVDEFQSKKHADRVWNACGKRFLNVCVQYRMAHAAKPS